MHSAVIPSSWIGLHPHQILTPRFWIRIAEYLVEENLEPTIANVKTAISAVSEYRTKGLLEAKELRRQAQEMMVRARELEEKEKWTKR